jgi:hypothetical protein
MIWDFCIAGIVGITLGLTAKNVRISMWIAKFLVLVKFEISAFKVAKIDCDRQEIIKRLGKRLISFGSISVLFLSFGLAIFLLPFLFLIIHKNEYVVVSLVTAIAAPIFAQRLYTYFAK